VATLAASVYPTKCAVNSSGALAAQAAPAATWLLHLPHEWGLIGNFCALPLYSQQVYRAMGLLPVAVPSLWQPYRPDGLRTTHSGPSRRVRALLCSCAPIHTHSLAHTHTHSLTHSLSLTHTLSHSHSHTAHTCHTCTCPLPPPPLTCDSSQVLCICSSWTTCISERRIRTGWPLRSLRGRVLN